MSVGALAVRHDTASAGVVRNSIAADLTTQHVARESIDDVVLVASELVGNAVLHTDDAASDLDVWWELERASVLVGVADRSVELPHRRALDSAAGGGRGLAIVAALADDWGVQQRRSGKQVWARVPVERN